MKQKQGFTLIELLIAAGILSVLLAALTGIFSSTSRSYKTNVQISEIQQDLEAATQLLKYEIGLAGYRGTDSGVAQRTFPTPTFRITKGSTEETSDSITISYYEDRFVPGTEPVLRTVTFTINAQKELTRREGNGTAQVIVKDINLFKVQGYIARGQEEPSPTLPTLDKLAGVTLTLQHVVGPPGNRRYTDRDVTIALHNQQR